MDRFVAGWSQGSSEPLPPTTVHVVRHGESLHNAKVFASYGADANDIRYADSPLTPHGEKQADSIAARIAAIDPDLIVCSPLTRALQTCLRACVGLSGSKVVVHRGLRERLAYSCDVGSRASVLRERFPGVDFGELEEVWWWREGEGEGSVEESVERLREGAPGSPTGVEPKEEWVKRAGHVKRWLVERPERNVVVFGHGVVLRALLADRGKQAPFLTNCEIRKIVL